MLRNAFLSLLLSTNVLFIGLAAMGFEVGCARSARYPLRLYDLKERQLLEKATTVIVGKTMEAQWETARLRINWSRQPGVSSVRLVQIRLSVEQVIRGTANDSQLTAYYWAPEVFSNGSSLHMPERGQRAVHYLVAEQGVLRYVTDLVRSTTPVFTGAHNQPPNAIGAGAEAKIAAILLTPGGGMNVGEFTRNLSTTAADSLQLVGFIGTLPLLKALGKSSVWDVKWAACVQLYDSGFMGHDGCIDRLAPEAAEHGRGMELRALQAQRANADSRFRHAFLADPIRTAKDYALLPGNGGIADFLRVIAQHPDKELAERAQKELESCCRGGPA